MRLLDSNEPDGYMLFSGLVYWRFEHDDLSNYDKRSRSSSGLGPFAPTVVAYPRPGNGSES